jgi:hypothetical protein
METVSMAIMLSGGAKIDSFRILVKEIAKEC